MSDDIVRISLEWRYVNDVTGLAGHMYLVARQADQKDGQGFAIDGNTRKDQAGNFTPLEVNNGNGAGSQLDTTIDVYQTGDSESSLNPVHDRHSVDILIAPTGENLNSIWAQMKAYANGIDPVEYPYDPSAILDPSGPALNSNSLIASVLASVGIDVNTYSPSIFPIDGFPGRDAFLGTAIDDDLTGFGDGVRMFGKGGDDTLTGTNDDDEIRGGDDNDRLFGLRGEDNIYGEAGNDTIFASANEDQTALENDLYDGGVGDDTVNYHAVQFGLNVSVNTTGMTVMQTGKEETDILKSIENLVLTNYNDTLEVGGGGSTGSQRHTLSDMGGGVDGVRGEMIWRRSTGTHFLPTTTQPSALTSFRMWRRLENPVIQEKSILIQQVLPIRQSDYASNDNQLIQRRVA